MTEGWKWHRTEVGERVQVCSHRSLAVKRHMLRLRETSAFLPSLATSRERPCCGDRSLPCGGPAVTAISQLYSVGGTVRHRGALELGSYHFVRLPFAISMPIFSSIHRIAWRFMRVGCLPLLLKVAILRLDPPESLDSSSCIMLSEARAAR